MGDGGFFSGLGDIVDRIKTPPDLLLLVGLGLFGTGVVKGPFSMENAMISFGLIALAASMAWRMLSYPVHRVTTGYEEHRYVQWSNLFWGSVFLIIGCMLAYHQFAHKWPVFHR